MGCDYLTTTNFKWTNMFVCSFLKEPIGQLQQEMQDRAVKDRREINVLEKTKEYLEKNIVDQEVGADG
jgi:hypothetical protein